MKDPYKKRDRYKKICDLLHNRFIKIADNGKFSRIKFWRLVFLDMILDWLENK